MARKTKGRGLTKADLVDAVYQRHGALTKDEAAEIVEAIFGTVKVNLERGRPVKIKNFGVFEVAERAGRVGVNPTSGEPLYIPPHKGLAFRPAARLKKQVAPTKRRPVPAPRAGAAASSAAKSGGAPASPTPVAAKPTPRRAARTRSEATDAEPTSRGGERAAERRDRR